jgi:hypothetical protein
VRVFSCRTKNRLGIVTLGHRVTIPRPPNQQVLLHREMTAENNAGINSDPLHAPTSKLCQLNCSRGLRYALILLHWARINGTGSEYEIQAIYKYWRIPMKWYVFSGQPLGTSD